MGAGMASIVPEFENHCNGRLASGFASTVQVEKPCEAANYPHEF